MRTALSDTLSLKHIYFFDNEVVDSRTSSPIAISKADKGTATVKVDPSVKDGHGERILNGVVEHSLNRCSSSVNQQTHNTFLQSCRCRKHNAGVAADHTKKQLTSYLLQETGDQSLPVPRKVFTSHVDSVSCSTTQQLPDEVLPHTDHSLIGSSAIPGPGMQADTETLTEVPDSYRETRDHGFAKAGHWDEYSTNTSPALDSSPMSLQPKEPIASAMDIGLPTVVEIPSDAKSVAILKTIKADKIKRAGPSAIPIPQGTSREFQALCAEWGIKIGALFTFRDAVDGLFGKALTISLSTSSSVLRQISHLSVLPKKSSLVASRNAPFRWVSSTLLEFEVPENTSIQYEGEKVSLLSANIKIDYSKDGKFTVLLSTSRLGGDDSTWSWSESHIRLLARFQYEQELLPVTLSHTGRNSKEVFSVKCDRR